MLMSTMIFEGEKFRKPCLIHKSVFFLERVQWRYDSGGGARVE